MPRVPHLEERPRQTVHRVEDLRVPVLEHHLQRTLPEVPRERRQHRRPEPQVPHPQHRHRQTVPACRRERGRRRLPPLLLEIEPAHPRFYVGTVARVESKAVDPFASYAAQLDTSAFFLGFRDSGRIENLNFYAGGAEGYQDAILPALSMGEESTEEYLPGTILLGARVGPDAPWIVSRNGPGSGISGGGSAEVLEDGSEGGAAFRYDFGILDQIEGVGRFAEVEGAALPTVRWTLRLRNRARQSVEIGELGFPMAFNNVMAPDGRSDEAVADIVETRFHLHAFAGGAGSFLAATRMSGMPPTILVTPRSDLGWEFAATIPASLRTPVPWEGIPAVYIHSRATVDREEWPEWANGHTSLVLEPGEERVYEMDFAAIVDPASTFDVAGSLARLGRPGTRFRAGAVAPVSQGVALDVMGVRPTRFWTDRDATLEIDSTEGGGSCLARAKRPGPLRLSFEDETGGITHTHALLVADPARSLPKWAKRAASPPTRRRREKDAEEGAIPVPPGSMLEVEEGLSDALLLASLARRAGLATGDAAQRILDAMVGVAIDPVTLGVASAVPPEIGTGVGFGHPRPGFRLGDVLSLLGNDPAARRAWDRALATGDADLLDGSAWGAAARAAGEESPGPLLARRPETLLSYRYPFLSGRAVSLEGMAEAMTYALQGRDAARVKRYCRMILAAKSPACHWWAFGTERRIGGPFECDRPECVLPLALDRGALSLAPWSSAHSALVLRAMAEGYVHPMEGTVSILEAGRRSALALLREDGRLAMTACPDPASLQFGSAPFAGDGGASLAAMLDAGLVVVDRQPYGLVSAGAASAFATLPAGFSGEAGEATWLLIEPTLPCREIRLPFLGVTLASDGAFIARARVALDRTSAAVELRAWNKAAREATARVEGLWGDPGDATLTVALDEDGAGEAEAAARPIPDPFARPAAEGPAPPRYPPFRDESLPRRYAPDDDGSHEEPPFDFEDEGDGE